MRGDRVIGTIVSKGSITARVDIGANDLATLNLLAFEGATKKNRPNMNVCYEYDVYRKDSKMS